METIETLTPAQAAAAGGVAGAMVGMTVATVIIFYVITVIATWKIFKKAGEPGWKCLIPIYNYYIMYKIVGMKNWFWWLFGICICASIIFAIDGYNPYTVDMAANYNFDYGAHPMTFITSIIVCAVAIYVGVTYAWRTSKAFGHGGGYFVGLLFLQPIFWLILGFGSSKYNKKAIKK